MASTQSPGADQQPSGPVRRMRFGPVTISFDSQVLEPRPWTVEQSRWAAAAASTVPDGPILELCAGAGQIGLVTALLTGRRIVQGDADARACRWATANARAAGLGDRVEVRTAALDAIARPGERFGLIIADPPYIPSHEVDGHAADPAHAIDGGEDGLDVARRCLTVAADHLLAGGLMSIQLGGTAQAGALLASLTETRGVVLHEDGLRAWGPDRAVLHMRRAPGSQ